MNDFKILYETDLRVSGFFLFLIPIGFITIGIFSSKLIKKHGYEHPLQKFGLFRLPYQNSIVRFFMLMVAGFGFIVLIALAFQFSSTFKTRVLIKNQIDQGFVKTVKGKVSNLTTTDKNTRIEEEFEIGNIRFKYTDSDDTFGYNRTADNNGVICCDGQNLRISYISLKNKNLILKIEEKQY